MSEKIVATRLAFMAEKHHLLHWWQIGGRPKRCAVDACLMIASTADEAKLKKLVTSTLCMDVKGAFDNVYLKRLLNTLIQKDFPCPAQKWVESFLSKRTARVAFDGEMENMTPVSTGIPQGSPVSPILLLLYISPLFEELEKEHPSARCPSYIDDVSLLVTGKTEAENSTILGKMAATAVTWGEKNAPMFDNPKTELRHFHSRLMTDPDANVRMPDGMVVKPELVLR